MAGESETLYNIAELRFGGGYGPEAYCMRPRPTLLPLQWVVSQSIVTIEEGGGALCARVQRTSVSDQKYRTYNQ